jgi:hypothetical protein
MSGSVIKLWALNGGTELAIGEGIESVLAAIKLGHAVPPAWAATVANNLRRLPVIPGVRRLTILADNDESGTSERAARDLRRSWLRSNADVLVRMPTEVGCDFNDLLIRQKS